MWTQVQILPGLLSLRNSFLPRYNGGMRTPKLIKVDTEHYKQTPAYLLEWDGQCGLVCLAPTEPGYCMCILFVQQTLSGKYKEMKKNKDAYLNLGSSSLNRLGDKIKHVAAIHHRNKSIYKIPEAMESLKLLDS